MVVSPMMIVDNTYDYFPCSVPEYCDQYSLDLSFWLAICILYPHGALLIFVPLG